MQRGGGEGETKKNPIPLFRSLYDGYYYIVMRRRYARGGPDASGRSRGLIYRRVYCVNGIIRGEGLTCTPRAVPVEKMVRVRTALYACDIIDMRAAGRVLYPGTQWEPNSGRDIKVHPSHPTFFFPMKSITEIQNSITRCCTLFVVFSRFPTVFLNNLICIFIINYNREITGQKTVYGYTKVYNMFKNSYLDPKC